MTDRAYSVIVEWDKPPHPVGRALLINMARLRLEGLLPDGKWDISGQELPAREQGLDAFTKGTRGFYFYATPAKAETPKRC